MIKGSSPHSQRSPEDHQSAPLSRCETHHNVGALQGTLQTEGVTHHDVGPLQGTLQTERVYCLQGMEDIKDITGCREIASWDQGRNQRWGKGGIKVFSEGASV